MFTRRQEKDATQRTAQLDETSRLKRELVAARAAHAEATRRLALHDDSARSRAAAAERVAALSSSFGSSVVASTKIMHGLHRDREAAAAASSSSGGAAFAPATPASPIERSRMDLADLSALASSVELQNAALGAQLDAL